MKQLTTIFYLLFFTICSSAQNVAEDKTLIKGFDSLPKIKYLDSISEIVKKPKRFNSIIGCLSNLSESDTVLNMNINMRLKDIAAKLYSENHYVIIIHGSGCADSIEDIKIGDNIYKINYLCSTTGCMISQSENQAIDCFNNYTKKLLNWFEPEKKSVNKKRKRA